MQRCLRAPGSPFDIAGPMTPLRSSGAQCAVARTENDVGVPLDRPYSPLSRPSSWRPTPPSIAPPSSFGSPRTRCATQLFAARTLGGARRRRRSPPRPADVPPLARHAGSDAGGARPAQRALRHAACPRWSTRRASSTRLDTMTDPFLRDVTRVLLSDEIVHAQFGFLYLDVHKEWLETPPGGPRLARALPPATPSSSSKQQMSGSGAFASARAYERRAGARPHLIRRVFAATFYRDGHRVPSFPGSSGTASTLRPRGASAPARGESSGGVPHGTIHGTGGARSRRHRRRARRN
jgi:hypothetical protein